jgi:hypothetical protein
MIKHGYKIIVAFLRNLFKHKSGNVCAMTEWTDSLLCEKCGKKLDLPYGGDVHEYTCSNCKKKYKVVPHEISYAIAESSSCDYFRYGSGGEIEARLFRNYPVDLLEEAWQDFQSTGDGEKNPHVLLPIVKKYHDAVKSYGRRLLEIHHGKLTPQDIRLIGKDDIRGKSLNIKNLFGYLKTAYPAKSPVIDEFYSTNKSLIERVWWVRNKQEHIIYSCWPVNAKIFEDLDKNPDNPDPALDNLNSDFVKRVNNLSVDICTLIIDLRPGAQDSWQYYSVEQFRCP